jgi:hypothetical protein
MVKRILAPFRWLKRVYAAAKAEGELWEEWKAWDDHIIALEEEGICPQGILSSEPFWDEWDGVDASLIGHSAPSLSHVRSKIAIIVSIINRFMTSMTYALRDLSNRWPHRFVEGRRDLPI